MISTTSILVAMILLGTITFLYRFSFISPWGKKWADRIPAEFLKLLGPATFAAIVVNNIATQPAEPEELRQKIVVAVLALLVAYFTRSILATLIFGMIALYIFRNYLPAMF